MERFSYKLKSLTKNKSFRYGLPFLLAILGGSFGLKEFAQIRYQFSRKTFITLEEARKHGIDMKRPGEVTIEGEFEKLKQLDIDNWEQVRGPRPWEENTTSVS